MNAAATLQDQRMDERMSILCSQPATTPRVYQHGDDWYASGSSYFTWAATPEKARAQWQAWSREHRASRGLA